MTPLLHRATAARWVSAALLALATPSAFAAFSLTTRWSGGVSSRLIYEIDTDSGLVFQVRGWDNAASTTSLGDIMSLVYKGVEYANPAAGTQVNSGFDFLYSGVSAVDLKAEMVSATGAATPAATGNGASVTGGEFIKLTVTVNSALGGVFKHYYLVKKGESRIYMGTYFTEEPSQHELARFIARVPVARLPYGGDAGVPGGLVGGYYPQDLRGTNTTVESADIFGFSSSVTDGRAGQTRSKHYSNMRLKDWTTFGGRNGPTAATSTVGLWFTRGKHEGDSGGPFYRSLLQQITSTTNEVTYMINYGHAQTEGFRTGVLNDYVLAFTDGAMPTAMPDTSWFSMMGLTGYVPASGRGAVSGSGISGRVAGVPYTVTLSNAQAQYWTDANPSDGSFTLPQVRPGNYTLKVHKGELAVASSPVTVSAGSTTPVGTLTIAAGTVPTGTDTTELIGDPGATAALWRIGSWDGTPQEFLNGDKVTWMHPTDVRMSPWVVPTYVVGSSTAAAHFPAYQWKDVNNARTITFRLTRAQAAALPKGLTIRIGTTADFNGARPQISVNGWTSAIPAAPPQATAKTRNLTTGSYRGFNRLYRYDVPLSQLVVGTNTLVVNVVSGTAGTAFLSPGLSYDAIDAIPTP